MSYGALATAVFVYGCIVATFLVIRGARRTRAMLEEDLHQRPPVYLGDCGPERVTPIRELRPLDQLINEAGRAVPPPTHRQFRAPPRSFDMVLARFDDPADPTTGETLFEAYRQRALAERLETTLAEDRQALDPHRFAMESMPLDEGGADDSAQR